MSDQWGDDYDSQRHKAVEESREDQHHQQTAEAQRDEHLVDHARADLILVGKHQKMYTAQCCEDHQKDERQRLMVVDDSKLENVSGMSQCRKM